MTDHIIIADKDSKDILLKWFEDRCNEHDYDKETRKLLGLKEKT